MDDNLASFNNGLDVIISVKGRTSKTRSLEVLHDESSQPHLNIAKCHNVVNFSQGCHPGLLIREKCKLVVGMDSEG